MNWLDWALVLLIAGAAVRGFFRGFVVEVATLVAVVLGLWAAARYNARVAAWTGLDPAHEVISFLVTFIAVLVGVHLLAKLITKAIDLAMMGLPNKLAGTLFGAVRAAFVLSVLLNVLMARTPVEGILPKDTLEGSALYGPLRGFAPLLVPALRDARWVRDAIDAVKGAAGEAAAEQH